MSEKLNKFNKSQKKSDLPDIRSGDTVRVYQKIKEGDKEKIQMFEGLVLARKHNKEMGGTITVRKVISGIGVEKIFPLHSPVIEKIEIIRRGKTRRAKLYYLRTAKGERARLKRKEFAEVIAKEEPKEVKKTEEIKVEK
ncbi:MAG TPA: 50S ribosomal protein L19 [Candidatus Parcubacteria bacterium]|jgi:large subunit ribosomal protein L19|nr:50S ribosomal protein L19 [Parcubacteria group bacterium]HJN62403.1 50S ribosomal protein L19 [Candidatus Parcubacteria bacterium]|tara:strand:+ start:4719 stop:5135 length:417 start_codon:yes stop_codon:yes gene_type:complete